MRSELIIKHIRKMLAAGALVVLGAFVLPQTAGEVKAADVIATNLSNLQAYLVDPTVTGEDTISFINGIDIDTDTTINLNGKKVKLGGTIEIFSGKTLTITDTGNGMIYVDQNYHLGQMINVNNGGSLNIEAGKLKIELNPNPSSDTAGVRVQAGGTLSMSGGLIENCGKAEAVYVYPGGSFTMSGNATINVSGSDSSSAVGCYGTFNMKGGRINVNSGHGIVINNDNPMYTYAQHTIQGNSSIENTGSGETVCVRGQYANVVMKDGTITCENGYALQVEGKATFTQEGGTISGDKSTERIITSYPGYYYVYATLGPNGGSGALTPTRLAWNDSFTLTNTFTREGYTFKEWNTEADGTGTSYPDGASLTMNDAKKLYAIWTQNGVPAPPQPSPDPDPDPEQPAPEPEQPQPQPEPEKPKRVASYDDDDDPIPSKFNFGGWYLTQMGDVEGRITTASGEDDSFEHFSGLQMDGGALTQGSDYLVRRGSTIITIKKDLLDRLGDGTHYVAALFDNGDIIIPITKGELKAKPSPKTGEV